MNEKEVRAEVHRLLRRHWFWPVAQTDMVTLLTHTEHKEFKSLIADAESWTRAFRTLTADLVVELEPVSQADSDRIDRAMSMLSHIHGLEQRVQELYGRVQRRQMPPKGRPDLLCPSPTRLSIVVEVKLYEKPKRAEEWASCPAFAFSKIDEAQHRWLTNFQEDADRKKHTGSYLALGTRHGTAGSLSNPRRLWLIPWHAWLVLEKRVKSCDQESLPLYAGKGRNKQLQELQLDAVNALELYRLDWVSGGWSAPFTHPLCLSQPFGRSERSLDEFSAKWPRRQRFV